MSRLLALLSAGRLARGAGRMVPARRVTAPGGVSRRALLGGIAAAPMALPAVVKAAATASSPVSGVVSRFVGESVTLDLHEGRPLPVMTSRGRWLLDEAVGVRTPESALAQIASERARWEGLGLALPAAPTCVAFIDDVGSGP